MSTDARYGLRRVAWLLVSPWDDKVAGPLPFFACGSNCYSTIFQYESLRITMPLRKV